jgi:Spy/CpxP family protein refolding chaperone
MKKTLIALVLTCVFATPALFAQTADTAPAGPSESARSAKMVQHRVNYLTTVLSLTAAQQAQVTSILTNAVANHSTTTTSMKTARTNLQNAIHSNDTAAMEQAANSISTLIAQKTLARAKAEAAIYQALTPEQQTKMSQLENEFHHGRHGY